MTLEVAADDLELIKDEKLKTEKIIQLLYFTPASKKEDLSHEIVFANDCILEFDIVLLEKEKLEELQLQELTKLFEDGLTKFLRLRFKVQDVAPKSKHLFIM